MNIYWPIAISLFTLIFGYFVGKEIEKYRRKNILITKLYDKYYEFIDLIMPIIFEIRHEADQYNIKPLIRNINDFIIKNKLDDNRSFREIFMCYYPYLTNDLIMSIYKFMDTYVELSLRDNKENNYKKLIGYYKELLMEMRKIIGTGRLAEEILKDLSGKAKFIKI